MAKIGVILSGCGVFDGSEVRESVLTLLALSELNQTVVFLAPNMTQHHTINHQTSSDSSTLRNVMEESARIARGPVLSLMDANPRDFDAVILPGGFGAAKNLSSFAFLGPKAELQPDLKKFLTGFYQLKNAKGAHRPMGAICIAPTILALLHRDIVCDVPPRLTIGDDADTAKALETLGCGHVLCQVDEICVDEANGFVTTPAYMYGSAPLHEISRGIHKLVSRVVDLI
jgi:enhancing lycopene biosynthesis protein 2